MFSLILRHFGMDESVVQSLQSGTHDIGWLKSVLPLPIREQFGDVQL